MTPFTACLRKQSNGQNTDRRPFSNERRCRRYNWMHVNVDNLNTHALSGDETSIGSASYWLPFICYKLICCYHKKASALHFKWIPCSSKSLSRTVSVDVKHHDYLLSKSSKSKYKEWLTGLKKEEEDPITITMLTDTDTDKPQKSCCSRSEICNRRCFISLEHSSHFRLNTSVVLQD